MQRGRERAAERGREERRRANCRGGEKTAEREKKLQRGR